MRLHCINHLIAQASHSFSNLPRLGPSRTFVLVDKRTLIQQILGHLDAELLRYAKAARAAEAEATDEQSRAENKYDTRGLEASYLAHGQGRQMLETRQARDQFAAMELREFEPGAAIGPGALVELEGAGERLWYFLGPAAGGTEIDWNGVEVLVITAQSPLGRRLIGAHRGDRVEVGAAGAGAMQRIASVT